MYISVTGGDADTRITSLMASLSLAYFGFVYKTGRLKKKTVCDKERPCRPLRRTVQRLVEDVLAEAQLQGFLAKVGEGKIKSLFATEEEWLAFHYKDTGMLKFEEVT